MSKFCVRNPSLRWPVPADLSQRLVGQTILAVQRRAKYLLLQTEGGYLMMHLGMSGSLRVVGADLPPGKHDHLDIAFDSGKVLRFTDPRRFGCALWVEGEPVKHPLLCKLGPEPFDSGFDGDYLFQCSRGRKLPIKQFLMDNQVVVGVGNIYANETLFRCGIHPGRAAGRISRARYQQLADEVKVVLEEAIAQGGTTLKDFVNGEGKPGYFKQQLQVYGRGGEPCVTCAVTLKEIRQGQRATVYCPNCQR